MANVLNPRKKFHRIIGQWRLFWGFCPRCNSDAPHVYKCSVCKQVHVPDKMITEPNNRQLYPPMPSTKALWLYSWLHPGYEEMQEEWEKHND